MSEHVDCSICLNPVEAKTTGRVETSCGHVFHFKCLTSWFSNQDDSSCPMCRQKPTELEDFSKEEEEEEEEEGDEHSELIGLSRVNMEYVLRNYGGIGVTYEVSVDVDYDLFGGGDAPIPRWLLERFLEQQGARKLSNSQWSQLKSIYPYYPEDDE
jgi:hypothetical protein